MSTVGDLKAAIHVELYKAMKKLGGHTGDLLAVSDQAPEELVGALRKLAKSDLLGIVGSWATRTKTSGCSKIYRNGNAGRV
jgi:hypothetical protein